MSASAPPPAGPPAPASPPAPPVVKVEGVVKSFGDNRILKGASLEVEPRELTVIVGPSGCGKTTLLRCLNGLESFDAGKITVAGITLEMKAGNGRRTAEVAAAVHELRLRAGMVFQSFNLFPHLTVIQNLLLGPRIVQKKSVEEARPAALELLRKVGLSDKADVYPVQLSGGQQQRVAIARSLAMQPKVMLYDEPTSALDPGLVDEVLGVMRDLHAEGMAQIVVTHEMRFARSVADQIVVFHGGEVIEAGKPEEIFTHPADERTRQFLKAYL